MTRRGFIGALTALVAVPRGWFAKLPRTTGTFIGYWDPVSPKLYRPDYRYTMTYTDGGGETASAAPTASPQNVTTRVLYVNGRRYDVPEGATYYHQTCGDGSGYFTFPK